MRPSDVLKMLTDQTEETCLIIIFTAERRGSTWGKKVPADAFGCWVKTNRFMDLQKCLWLSAFLTSARYMIGADMFSLHRHFISHPAPPFNTFLIVLIDCSAPATRSHSKLTHGWMFDWLSVWQPMPQPSDSLSAVSQCQEYCCVFFCLFFFSVNDSPVK